MSDFTLALTMHLAALALIVAEVFIPSFGMLTIVAVFALFGSWYYLLSSAPDWAIPFFAVGDLTLFPLVVWWCLKLLNKSSLSNKEVLSVEEGFQIDHHYSNDLIGKRGKVVSTLRPSGEIEIEGELLDALSDSNFIEKGSVVEVLKISENKIVVVAVEGL